MRIDSAKLFEGSNFANLTIVSGPSFPSLPNVGELFFNTTDDSLYFYNGTAWVNPGSSGANIHFSATAPANPVDYPLWWHTEFGALLIWYTDADSSQWVEVSGAGGVSGVTVNPVTPVEGDIQISGSTISMYADGAWRQIFPAVYS